MTSSSSSSSLSFFGSVLPGIPVITPGSLQSSRVVCVDDGGASFLLGNGLGVYSVTLTEPAQYTAIPSKQGSVPFFPVPLASCSARPVHSLHGAPVEAVCLSPAGRDFASVDAVAGLVLGRCDGGGQAVRVELGVPRCEEGWCGVDWLADDTVQVARFYGRDVVSYGEDGRFVRRVGLSEGPSAIRACGLGGASGQATSAVAVLNEIVLVDQRAASALVGRVNAGQDRLLSIDVQGNRLAACGEDRIAVVVDARTLKPICKFSGASKHESALVRINPAAPDVVVVGSYGELLSHNANTKKKQSSHHGFMADGRWIGFDHSKDGQHLIGVAETGSAYLIKHPSQMA